MLWTCLLLPALPLEVYTRAQAPADGARPFAVTAGGHPPRVVAANAAAADAGIRSDQHVSAALALAPGIVLRERDPGAEAAALAAIATWATQFTPTVSLAPPNAVLAEIGGSLRLFGGLAHLAAQVARGVRDLGYTAHLAFAPTPTAALLFARAGENGVRSNFRVKIRPDPMLAAEIGPDPIFAMRVELTIDGGFAFIPGLAKPIVLDDAQLSGEDSNNLRRLCQAALTTPRQHAATPLAALPDARRYRLTIEIDDQRHELVAADPITERAVAELIDFVTLRRRP